MAIGAGNTAVTATATGTAIAAAAMTGGTTTAMTEAIAGSAKRA